MAETLPDGTSISKQAAEGWEKIGVSFETRQFGPEGWENTIEFEAPSLSVPTDPSGEFTVSGTWKFDDGRAIPNETITVEVTDSTGTVVSSVQTTTDANGDFSVTFDPGPGDYEVKAYNTGRGRQFGPEGWEE